MWLFPWLLNFDLLVGRKPSRLWQCSILQGYLVNPRVREAEGNDVARSISIPAISGITVGEPLRSVKKSGSPATFDL